MGLFRARPFSSGIVASFLFYGAMYGVLFLLPQFLQAAQGHDAMGAGVRLPDREGAVCRVSVGMKVEPGRWTCRSRRNHREISARFDKSA